MEKIWNFIKHEDGLETVEWAVMAALIAVGLVAVLSSLGDNVLARFQILQNATSGN